MVIRNMIIRIKKKKSDVHAFFKMDSLKNETINGEKFYTIRFLFLG